MKIKSFIADLYRPIDASILGYFRIVFGIVMLISFFEVEDYFVNNLSHQGFFFKYDFLEWIQLLPSYELSILFIILKISSCLFILGFAYRINSVILFLGWGYLFFCERGHYNNHFYFYFLTLFFFCFVNADRWGAFKLKKSKEQTIPYWQLFIFKLQIFIVYFYGGIAKLNADWLLGHPMINWLHIKESHLPELIRLIVANKNGPIFISYTGLIFDLVIGFLLFSNRWRYFALIPIFIFNVLNHFLWNIGTFPWAMIGATFLFFDPDWPRWFIKKLKEFKFKLPKGIFKKLYSPESRNLFIGKSTPQPVKLITILIGLFFLFQFLFPLRHLLFKGDVAWNGEGHLFSWRMMLTSSDDAIRIRMKFPNDPNVYYVDMFAYMNRGQLNKITKTPKMVIKFTEHLKEKIYKQSGISDFEIHMEIYKSVNFREPQLLNDTTLNYAHVKYNYFKGAEWILPWKQTTSDLPKEIKDDSHWKGILFE